MLTFGLLHGDGLRDPWDPWSRVVDGDDSDVVICPLREAGDGEGEVLTPELCAAAPLLLAHQHLGGGGAQGLYVYTDIHVSLYMNMYH